MSLRARPPWRFPLPLLADADFVTELKDALDRLKADRLHQQDSARLPPKAKWELVPLTFDRLWSVLTLTLIYILVVGQFGLATGSGGIAQSNVQTTTRVHK